jgi:hypothetical protein
VVEMMLASNSVTGGSVSRDAEEASKQNAVQQASSSTSAGEDVFVKDRRIAGGVDIFLMSKLRYAMCLNIPYCIIL